MTTFEYHPEMSSVCRSSSFIMPKIFFLVIHSNLACTSQWYSARNITATFLPILLPLVFLLIHSIPLSSSLCVNQVWRKKRSAHIYLLIKFTDSRSLINPLTFSLYRVYVCLELFTPCLNWVSSTLFLHLTLSWFQSQKERQQYK